MHDLAIVGGGPAGLCVAYHLRDLPLDVVVLEAGGDVGGRTLSVPVGGLTSNTGALFVYRGTPSEELAAELGVPTAPFRPATFGIHLGETTAVGTDDAEILARLPLSDLARAQLSRFIDQALQEYRAHTAGGRLAESSAALVDQRVAERLVGLEPEVVDIITRGVQGGSVAPPGELSAKWALRYFASYLARESGNRLYPLEGMQTIPYGLASALGEDVVRLGTAVTEVARQAGATTEHYALRTAGGATVRAREVVLAVPAPVTLRIARDLPDWKRAALEAVSTPGSTTLAITADATGLDDVVDWAFVITCGRPFDVVINPLPGVGRRSTDGRRLVQFVCYGNAAGYRPDLVADDEGTDAWVEEFLVVAPQLRGRIVGAHLQTWEHCFAILTPERLAALAALQESVAGLHFAGDHTSATAGTHGAYAEARRVADLIRARRG